MSIISTVAESRSNSKPSTAASKSKAPANGKTPGRSTPKSPAREIFKDAPFIPFYPELGRKIGSLEALLIMQIDYWLVFWPNMVKKQGGENWLNMSSKQMHEYSFGFVTPQGINIALNRLVARGLLRERRQGNRRLFQVDYEALKKLRSETELSIESKPSTTEFSTVDNAVVKIESPVNNSVVKPENSVVEPAVCKEEDSKKTAKAPTRRGGDSQKRTKWEDKGVAYSTAVWEMSQALEEVCEIKPRLNDNQRKIRQTAVKLVDSGVTPEQVYNFPNWWKTEDWRGQKGDIPRLKELEETIQKAIRHAEKEAIAVFADFRYMADPACPTCGGLGWRRGTGEILPCECTMRLSAPTRQAE